MVDAITEGTFLAVVAGTETGDNWWLWKPMVIVESRSSWKLLDGDLPSFPHWGDYSCPASAAASFSVKIIRSSRVSQLARLSETLQQ